MIFSSVPPQRSLRRAAAAVEFALIAPVFFLLVIGMIEVGRALMVQQVLINAAREGARQATLPLATDAQVTATVSNYLAAAGIKGSTPTLSPTLASTPASGAPLSLTITVPFAQVAWSPPMLFNGKSLSATVVMIKE